MASLTNNTRIANRYGLNLRLCNADDFSIVYQTINFANISAVDMSGGTVFARGGTMRENRVGFYDNLVGQLTVSTQILTNDLMCLMTGRAAKWDGSRPIVFKNHLFDKPRSFALIGDTVWRDKKGNIYHEQLTFHKVMPRIAYNRKYAGDGDVANVDIVFDILQDASGQILTRGEPQLDISGSTLITSYGYVTEDGVWVLENMASVDGDTLILE